MSFWEQLESARVKLLDMGVRGNTLLNFRGGAKALKIVDENSDDVFRILVENGKTMSFRALPEKEAGEDDETDDSAPLPNFEKIYGEGRHTDTNLQTNLIRDKLDKRLIRINNEANTYFQEQGVDVLFLALGFLTWFESSNSRESRKAPLVLIPVELERADVRGKFKIRYTDADIGTNLTLKTKLSKEFSINLPEIKDDFDFNSYLDLMEKSIANIPEWKINRNEIHLGFFSFGRFQMYQDLDAELWQGADKHQILQPLLGGGFGTSSDKEIMRDGLKQVSGAAHLVDAGVNDVYHKLHLVKDADSSQTEAVVAVKTGKHLVIQGPPGTGKSQTITNIIAESLAAGKKVLFVAEKMAALEVVKRRLDECQLGVAVLELHSHKSNKKEVLEELKKTLDLGCPDIKKTEQDKARHVKLKGELDDYSKAVNEPLLNSGVSYIDALGRLLSIRQESAGVNPSKSAFEPMRGWTNAEFEEARISVEEIADYLEKMLQKTGSPIAESVFKHSELRDINPMDKENLDESLHDLVERMKRLIETAKNLTGDMGLNIPLMKLVHLADWVRTVPDIAGLNLVADGWRANQSAISELLEAGRVMATIKEKRSGQLMERGWDMDFLTTRQILVDMGHKWWRKLSGKFRKAEAQVRGVSTNFGLGLGEVLALIDDVLQYQSKRQIFNQHSALGRELFGDRWKDAHSDWNALAHLREWVFAAHKRISDGDLPSESLVWLVERPPQPDWGERFGALSQDATDVLNKFSDARQALGFPSSDWNEFNLTSLHKDVKSWHDNLEQLYDLTRYNRLKEKIEKAGLSELAGLCDAWTDSAKNLVNLFMLIWYEGLIREAYGSRPILSRFYRTEHESKIAEFKKLDKALFRMAQESLVNMHYNALPKESSPGEMNILRTEMNKQRKIMPIRRLLSKAGRAIQEIKPVFMMSPISVATYLVPNSVKFDLVVFDEASQVRVEDALSPLLRARQAVVVGDDKQMPPTNFFRKILDSGDDEEEDDETEGIESILNMFLAKGAPEKMLRWHYRSRHDSLIAVSNREFYDGKLMIFPSPGNHPRAKGLVLRHNRNNLYNASINPKEAREIAEAVMEHVKRHEELTLGVVAFSTKQRDCILLEVERLRRENPELESFFTEKRDDGENFFIKNLENVQGDERDVILISVCYGRNEAGRILQNFGPVNREGGQRRLNVLFTRAKLGMVVFSNFTAADLEITNDSPPGIRALKAFLHFAENREHLTTVESGRDLDSPFEREVMCAIERLGFEVMPQVGVAGFFIDLAVRHPEKPGQYVLAVECDGARYHSSASARDRDRLRQEVLEELGWSFHRIWSTDWFKNQDDEIKRLDDSIKKQIARSNIAENEIIPPPVKSSDNVQIVRRSEMLPNSETPPYRITDGTFGLKSGIDIHEQPQHIMIDAITDVVNHEGPINATEVMRRICESVGISRIGNRIRDAMNNAIWFGGRDGKFSVKGDFLHSNGQKFSPRNRSHLSPSQKKIEIIAPEELDAALLKTIAHAFTIDEDDLISESVNLLGFNRVTDNVREILQKRIAALLSDGLLQKSGEKFQPGRKKDERFI